jgi:hypothetical protein
MQVPFPTRSTSADVSPTNPEPRKYPHPNTLAEPVKHVDDGSDAPDRFDIHRFEDDGGAVPNDLDQPAAGSARRRS